MNGIPPQSPACARARELIHQVLDGDLMEAAVRAEIDGHLETCTACREFRGELSLIQQGLRGLPVTPLPDDGLEQVWDRTIRSRKVIRLRGWGFDWRFAAAAAVIFLAAFLGIQTWNAPPRSPEPSRTELTRAAREMRLVLSLTSGALHKTGTVAVKNILADEVSPALRRVPVRWPAGAADGQRRSES